MNQQLLRDRLAQLQALAGMKVRMWHYTSSHDRLTYRVINKSETQEQHLHFLSCVDIQSPTFWTITNPLLSPEPDGLLVFTDQGVRITCVDVQVTDETETTKETPNQAL